MMKDFDFVICSKKGTMSRTKKYKNVFERIKTTVDFLEEKDLKNTVIKP